MGTRVRYGSLAIGAYYANQPGSAQPAFDVYENNKDWNYPRRTIQGINDPLNWVCRWSRGRFGGGAESGQGYSPIGTNLEGGLYNEFSNFGRGSPGIKFIKGQVRDASDNLIPGAVVQGFVTSTDAFTGEAISKADGTYEVPTQNPGVNHYVVGYIAGSPDRGGTTVNTLLPANLDGTP